MSNRLDYKKYYNKINVVSEPASIGVHGVNINCATTAGAVRADRRPILLPLLRSIGDGGHQ